MRNSIYTHRVLGKDTDIMTTVSVGNNENVAFELRRDGLRLYAASAGARIELQFAVSTTAPTPTVSSGPFHITADLYAGRNTNEGGRMVGQLVAQNQVAPTANGAHVTLAGYISAEQLREIEERRGGGTLTLKLDYSLFCTTADGMQRHAGQEYLHIRAGEWADELERVEAAGYVAVLVPMPTGDAFALAVRRITEAQGLLRNNDVDAALGAARLALEAVRDELDAMNVLAGAPKPKERSLVERRVAVVEAAYSFLCGAMHDDDLTKTFRYTRTDAATMIATVAGLLRGVTEVL
jgi:hypothetical protein